MKALRFLIGVLFAIAAGLSLIVLMLIGTGDGGELRLSEFRWDRTVLGILAAVTALTLVGALAMGLGSTAKSGWRSIWCLVPLALTVGFWFAPDTTAAAAVGVDRMVASLPGFRGRNPVGRRSPPGYCGRGMGLAGHSGRHRFGLGDRHHRCSGRMDRTGTGLGGGTDGAGPASQLGLVRAAH